MHCGDRVGVSRVDDAVGPELSRDREWQFVEVARDDLGRAVVLQHGDDKRADGTSADDKHTLASHVARLAHAVPGDGGGLCERGKLEVEALRQHAEHARRQGDSTRERSLRVRDASSRTEVGTGRREVRTVGRVGRHAVVARRRGVDRHSLADRGAAAVSRCFENGADDLVAEDERVAEDRLPAAPCIQ